jgi:hypothetical protein
MVRLQCQSAPSRISQTLYGCAAATAALAVRTAIVAKAMALMRMIEPHCLINGFSMRRVGFGRLSSGSEFGFTRSRICFFDRPVMKQMGKLPIGTVKASVERRLGFLA